MRRTEMMIGDPANNLAAVSLIRAAIADDADSGLLIIGEHGGLRDQETSVFIMALAAVAARALMSANSYNIERTVKLLDTWASEYAGSEAVG
jgi:hypothetical protein